MPAIENAALLLRLLGASDSPLSFSQLVASSGLAKSSVNNVCGSLVRTGLADRLEDGRYVLGFKLIEFSHRRLTTFAVLSHFNEVCETRSDLPDEAVVLAVLDGRDALYLARRNGSKPIDSDYQRIGQRLPAAFTATGKCLLSMHSDEYVRGLYAGHRGIANPLGNRTKQVSTLLAELARVRGEGFSRDEEETVPGMLCVGAPIVDAHPQSSDPPAALAFSVVQAVTTSTREEDLVGYARSLAREIGERLTRSPQR
jgi:DNA-binding IclR family transcriptional regulator